MSTPAQIGKNEYKAEIASARQASLSVHVVLRRIMQDDASSNLVRVFVGQAALDLADIDKAINRLDEIGRNTK
jgi:hypothetical protein